MSNTALGSQTGHRGPGIETLVKTPELGLPLSLRPNIAPNNRVRDIVKSYRRDPAPIQFRQQVLPRHGPKVDGCDRLG
jgi:hypothetical protein